MDVTASGHKDGLLDRLGWRMNPAVPSDLEQVVLKCMAKNPSDRFQDAASLMVALDGCSVAQRWGTEQAANWWQSSQEQKQEQKVEKSETKPSVDATVDYDGCNS